jgi:hypothetical protein
MCKGKYDLKPGKHKKGMHGLKEVNFVGEPEKMMKGKKKKTVPVGMYANKKDILKY